MGLHPQWYLVVRFVLGYNKTLAQGPPWGVFKIDRRSRRLATCANFARRQTAIGTGAPRPSGRWGGGRPGAPPSPRRPGGAPPKPLRWVQVRRS